MGAGPSRPVRGDPYGCPMPQMGHRVVDPREGPWGWGGAESDLQWVGGNRHGPMMPGWAEVRPGHGQHGMMGGHGGHGQHGMMGDMVGMVGITAVLTAVMAVCMEVTADTADIPADMAATDGPTAEVMGLTADMAATSANHITQEAITQLANTEVDSMAEGSAEAETTTEDITVGTAAVSPAAKHVLQTPTSPDSIYLSKAAGRRAMVMVMKGGWESRSNAYIP